MEFDAKDGIILALGESAFREVYPVVNKDLCKENLYYPEWVEI